MISIVMNYSVPVIGIMASCVLATSLPIIIKKYLGGIGKRTIEIYLLHRFLFRLNVRQICLQSFSMQLYHLGYP